MNAAPNIVFDRGIDWSQGDLLDACYWPVNTGLQLGGVLKPADDFRDGARTPDSKNMNLDDWVCTVCGEWFPKLSEVDTHSYRTSHLPFKCITCDQVYSHYGLLESHGRYLQHEIMACNFAGCNVRFADAEEKRVHHDLPHTTDHGRLVTATAFECAQCKQSLGSKANLTRHGVENQHQPYGCMCGNLFSRLDVLNRHLRAFDTSLPQYPCNFCRRHRGEDGFRRKDHLKQHMVSYHHHELGDEATSHGRSRSQFVYPVCHHVGCEKFRSPDFQKLPRSDKESYKPFPKLSDYSKHMREEHDECTYPCNVLDCNRVGRRGYFREKDLMKHRREQHPDADPYQAPKRDSKYRCTEPGCSSILDPNSVREHYLVVHK